MRAGRGGPVLIERDEDARVRIVLVQDELRGAERFGEQVHVDGLRLLARRSPSSSRSSTSLSMIQWWMRPCGASCCE